MADNRNTVTSSTLLRTGTGSLIGMVLSASTGTTTFTFWNNTASSATKILEIHVSNAQPVILFLSEMFFIDFTTGLYLTVGSNGSATVWWRDY